MLFRAILEPSNGTCPIEKVFQDAFFCYNYVKIRVTVLDYLDRTSPLLFEIVYHLIVVCKCVEQRALRIRAGNTHVLLVVVECIRPHSDLTISTQIERIFLTKNSAFSLAKHFV